MTTLRRSERIKNQYHKEKHILPKIGKDNTSNDKTESKMKNINIVKLNYYFINTNIKYIDEHQTDINSFTETISFIFTQYLSFLIIIIPILINKVIYSSVYEDIVSCIFYRSLIYKHWMVQLFKNINLKTLTQLKKTKKEKESSIKKLLGSVTKRNNDIYNKTIEKYMNNKKNYKSF